MMSLVKDSPKKAKAPAHERMLRSLKIDERDIHELLLYAPRTFRDYSTIIESVADLNRYDNGAQVVLKARFTLAEYFDRSDRPTRLFERSQDRRPIRAKVRLTDVQGAKTDVMLFGNVWPLKDCAEGDTLYFTGKVGRYYDEVQLRDAQPLAPTLAGRVLPIYPALTGKVSAEDISTVMAALSQNKEMVLKAALALQERLDITSDWIKDRISIGPNRLIYSMHAPQSLAQGEYCLKAARDITVAWLFERASRVRNRALTVRSMLGIPREHIESCLKAISHRYSLTQDQKTAIRDIFNDLSAPHPMRRLLSGDVGTGKTITFLVPAVSAKRSGYQVGILAPNSSVASQIATEIAELWPDVNVQLVTDKTRSLVDGALLVGTTALHSRVHKAGITLDLMVVDEQHKFSRDQREALLAKGTNLLEATATAVPRTMALVNYSGMPVSCLKQTPFEKNILTRIVSESDKATLLRAVYHILKSGGQMAIVYGAVDKSDKLITVDEAADKWEKLMPGRVVRLHGKMSSDQKAQGLQAFRDGRHDLLVSSTLIEVGVSVPNLRGIIIVNAERLGVSQLHQLRGRVARRGGNGLCILHAADDIKDDTLARLQLLEQTSDGFTLAERDLEQRGFGSLESEADLQTGKTSYAFMNIPIFPHDLKAAVEVARAARTPARATASA